MPPVDYPRDLSIDNAAIEVETGRGCCWQTTGRVRTLKFTSGTIGVCLCAWFIGGTLRRGVGTSVEDPEAVIVQQTVWMVTAGLSQLVNVLFW